MHGANIEMRQTTGNEATNMADKMEVESAAEPNGLFLICKAEEDYAERVSLLPLIGTIF